MDYDKFYNTYESDAIALIEEREPFTEVLRPEVDKIIDSWWERRFEDDDAYDRKEEK